MANGLVRMWRRLAPGWRNLAAEEQEHIARLRRRGVKIGEHCRIFTNSFSTEPYLITIGDWCGIAGGVTFITHEPAAAFLQEHRPKVEIFGTIEVSEQCLIGQNAIILPNTWIGRRSIIAAGSTVRGKIPENSLVIGNPGRVIGRASLYIERLAESPDALDTFRIPEPERRNMIMRHFGLEKTQHGP